MITDAAGSRILLCAPLLARAHEPSRNQCYIQYFLLLIAAFLSTYLFCSSLRCVTLCPYMPLFSRLSTIVLQPFGFQYRRLPFYCRLIFRQPPPPLLSLVSFLFYITAPVFFFNPLVSSDFHVGEYGLRHIYLTEVGTAISSSASSSSLAISCLFAVPSRRKSESER